MIGTVLRLFRWFPRTWGAIDRQAESERAAAAMPTGAGSDTRVAQILVVASLVLIFEWYYGDRPFFHEMWDARLLTHPRYGPYVELLAFTWWSGCKLLGFLVVPVLHVWLMKGRLRDHGMPIDIGRGVDGGHRPRAASSESNVDVQGPILPWRRTYVTLFLLVLPLVVLVSFTSAFQHTYPFYHLTGRSFLDFFGWELQYGLTFLSVEFFFRGYLLFGLRRAMGSNAIFVMVVPYCLIHILKPAAESVAAIVAGVVLGTLALSTGSIWCGVLIHVSVAWSMDLLAALQTQGLPPWGRWLPQVHGLH